MSEIKELLLEKDSLEVKGVDTLDDYELDRYYMIKDRITEIVGGNKNVQRNIEKYLERRDRR